jgi:hypothetical protein
MNLKEQIEEDIFRVFLNPQDFGEFHTVNGSRVLSIIDKNNVHMRSTVRLQVGRGAEGVHEDSLFVYVKATEFAKPPKPHEPIEVDGKSYVIRSVSDEMGILVIEYGGVSDSRHITGNRPHPF